MIEHMTGIPAKPLETSRDEEEYREAYHRIAAKSYQSRKEIMRKVRQTIQPEVA